ncbi:Beta-glucosidase 24 [Linum perenne]
MVVRTNPNLLLLLLIQLVIGTRCLGDTISSTNIVPSKPSNTTRKYSLRRRQFPSDFFFGVTTSAYQHEGATWEDGRRPSVWDAYSHAHPENITGKTTGDVASDSYHLYKLSGGINKKGVQHYNNVIDEVLAQGLIPFVSLVHMDTPQFLEDEYGGFLSRHIVKDFRDYANLCFKEYGDRVKYWVTLNEPYTYCRGGYDVGDLAPGRCSTCDEGNSTIEPYIVGHNQLIAHATVVQLYRRKYQAAQKGIIGIAMNVDWFFPYSSSKLDKLAAKRALDFNFGWFMDPIYRGEYPHNLKYYVGDRLPKFSKRESKLLKGSFDFLGINYYTSRYAIHGIAKHPNHPNGEDNHVLLTHTGRDGKLIGPLTDAKWMAIYPRGLSILLLHIKDTYQNPPIYITENGAPDTGNYTHSPLKATPDDPIRLKFIKGHISSLRRAMRCVANEFILIRSI